MIIKNNKIVTSYTNDSSTSKKACGFWCRMVRGAIVAVCTAVGGGLGALVGAALASQVEFKTIEFDTDGLTELEINALTFWLNTQFSPKYSKILQKGNYLLKFTNAIEQLKLINEVYLEIELIKKWLLIDKNKNLSALAIEVRNETVIEQLEYLQSLIYSAMLNSGNKYEEVQVSAIGTSSLLNPIVIEQEFKTTVTNFNIIQDNGDSISENDLSSDLETGGDTEYIPDPIVTPVDNTKKSSYGKVIAFLLGAAVLYKVIKK